MKIMPAIDLLDGKCVRLLKGDYSKISNYNNNPLDQINEFKKAGFDYIHIIDLNAAKSGGDENLLLIEEISQIKNIKIQVGGGIRDSKKIERLFSFNLFITTPAVPTPGKIKASIFSSSDKELLIYDLIFILLNE